MKTAIIYASKHGTTEKVAHSIADKLKGTNEVELFSLNANPKPDINAFEMVIIGSSIYAGQASKKVKAFCKENESLLLQKKIGLFTCGMQPEKENQEKELQAAFPEVLLKHSKATNFLGGELLFEQMNFFERMLVKKFMKIKSSVHQIDWDGVEDLAKRLQEKHS
ncbi:MAG: flavodoxin domain-containing protein [Bacteroidetes bacterium]|nr:flavodoxin domain-containing protein [Bacteroidota bacterium]MCL2301794.1 flavodoxin domain-containing protein [Lentimicrobiaceae bacterium]